MTEIDRVSPTRRPAGPVRGHQRWRRLVFLHWPVPADVLRPLVPRGLDVDEFDGTAYVGVVAFAMQGVRPSWAPEAVAFDFLETNVRTYVHAGGRDPGVFFLSLDAASRIAVHVARALWSLPYYFATMRLDPNGRRVHYALERRSGARPKLDVSYEIRSPLGASRPGSLEHFLIERYLLHVERRGRIYTGQVHHSPYPVESARADAVHDELVAAAGLPAPSEPPPLVHYAEGVDVEIFDLTPRASAQ
jgi:uncharacterized protein